MHTKAKILLFTLLGAVVTLGSPLAYAQATGDEVFITELLEASASTAGTGAVAGFVMSLVAVLGKRIKKITNDKGEVEPIKLVKLIVTVAIAGAIGWVAPSFGIVNEVSIPAVIGLTYMVNQTLKPVFTAWTVK